MDTEQMKQPVKPWEFRAKPAWQRLLIMIGGVLVNFFLAFFIYSMVLFTWGETYVPVKNMTHGFKFNETAKSYGFRDGDIPCAPIRAPSRASTPTKPWATCTAVFPRPVRLWCGAAERK